MIKTNHDFTCEDVNCMFKFISYNSQNHFGRPHRCKLNNEIAKQIFEEHGITTCEFGMRQHNMNITEERNLYRIINQMIREEKANGNL
jgi:precorrin isomerase